MFIGGGKGDSEDTRCSHSETVLRRAAPKNGIWYYNNRNIEIVCSLVDIDNIVQLTVIIVCLSDVTDGVWTVDQYLRSGKRFDINLRIERRELCYNYV